MDSYDILVISLGVLLGLLLIISIIFSVVLLQVLLRIKSATEKAKIVADNLSSVTASLKGVGKLTAAGTILKQIIKLSRKGKK